jgi:hypothetical protein
MSNGKQLALYLFMSFFVIGLFLNGAWIWILSALVLLLFLKVLISFLMQKTPSQEFEHYDAYEENGGYHRRGVGRKYRRYRK